MPLAVFQPLCLVVLAAAYAITLVGAEDRRRCGSEIGALAVGAWLGEHSCIELYGFYAYADGWWLRIGHVPALIPLIWPMVVLSARAVYDALWPGRGWLGRAIGVAFIVIFDASLMEVVAVAAGYWRWAEGGHLGVPLMGIVGWGCFAFAAIVWLSRARSRGTLAALPLVAASGAHLAIVAIWWLGLRWVLRGELPRELSLLGFALVSLCFAVVAGLARRERRGLGPGLTASRVLATSVFLVLVVWIGGADGPWLGIHFGLVAFPYLVATEWGALRFPASVSASADEYVRR